MRGGATIAILSVRLHKELRVILVAAAACALLAYLQRYDDAAARVAGCLVFGTLFGVGSALLQRGARRFRELELCEQTAPLYGRELARATALVPCAIVSAALAGYWIVASIYQPPGAVSLAVTLTACYAATLTAMSATVRTGFPRLFYVALACGVSAIAFELLRWPPAIAVSFCVVSGFIALRQYGEALARYDPV